jgi:hypothetical protein
LQSRFACLGQKIEARYNIWLKMEGSGHVYEMLYMKYWPDFIPVFMEKEKRGLDGFQIMY